MKNRNSNQSEISTLIQLTDKDPEIKKRILELLQLSPFERRFKLNIWTEQLQQRKASENLRNALLILFDDLVAEQVLKLIYNSHMQEI
jgi:hypothetical protein